MAGLQVNVLMEAEGEPKLMDLSQKDQLKVIIEQLENVGWIVLKNATRVDPADNAPMAFYLENKVSPLI